MGTAAVSQLCTSGTSSSTDVTEGSVRLCENRADGECTLSFKLRGGEFPEFPGPIPSIFFSFSLGVHIMDICVMFIFIYMPLVLE